MVDRHAPAPPSMPPWAVIGEDWHLCRAAHISPEGFHSLSLQLWGICLERPKTRLSAVPVDMFEEIHLRLPPLSVNGVDSVPRKLAIVPFGFSPYIRTADSICYGYHQLFAPGTVLEVSLPQGNRPRYLKGYSFPFMGTATPYYELRVNPKNTGKCPGRCRFCHRGYSFRMPPPQASGILSPSTILRAILAEQGPTCLGAIDHISVITELFGNEEAFLSYVEELKVIFLKNGCKTETSFRACSQDVRTEEGLRHHASMRSEEHTSYTLEVFSERRTIMGGYKGIELGAVEAILETAKRVGFRTIKLNYVAGIDSLESFELGVRRLKCAGLVDSLGLR